MRRNSLILVGVMTLLTVILAACTGAAIADEVLIPDTVRRNESVSVDDSGPQDDQSDVLEPEVAEEPDVEGEPEVREPREGLEATDPSTVVLASGQPQIVEFFAFW